VDRSYGHLGRQRIVGAAWRLAVNRRYLRALWVVVGLTLGFGGQPLIALDESAEQPPRRVASFRILCEENKSFLTEDDLLGYFWPTHTMIVKPGVITRLESGPWREAATPFKVEANGVICYRGVIESAFAGAAFRWEPCAKILRGFPLGSHKNGNRWKAELPITLDSDFKGKDPRGDPRIRQALGALGKLVGGEDTGNRTLAVRAAANIDTDDRDAPRKLKRALNDANPLVRQAAADALCRITAPEKPQPQNRPDKERLQGRWKAVSGEMDGKQLPAISIGDLTVTFDADQLTMTPDRTSLAQYQTSFAQFRTSLVQWEKIPFQPPAMPGNGDPPLRFRIDPAKSPKELSITIQEPGNQLVIPQKNIYSLKDDCLTICWGIDDRPEGFTTKPRDKRMLLVYRRSLGAERFFYALATQWGLHCEQGHSTIEDDLGLPYYGLVRLGKEAVPLIIERFQREDWDNDARPWELVLDEITGLQMVDDRRAYSPQIVRQRYLEWWEEAKTQYDQ
jgi:hypothetical protein